MYVIGNRAVEPQKSLHCAVLIAGVEFDSFVLETHPNVWLAQILYSLLAES